MPEWVPPEIKRKLPCLKCGTDADQQLVLTREGTSWKCISCDRLTPAFTHAQMREMVVNKVFKLPVTPLAVDKVPPGLKVYLEYHGDVPAGMAKEKEVADECVLEHIQITGALPEVNKPLFTAPKVLGMAHLLEKEDMRRAFAVPYGKVVRVVTGESA